MTTERLFMRHIREVLRQKWVLGLSHRAVAASLGLSVGVIAATLGRPRAAGLEWPAVDGLDDQALQARLYGASAAPQRPRPDPAYLHTERKKPGVTLELLHQEYLAQHPDGYQYTQFCDHYRRWCQARRLSMRQVHRAGEKLFVDYSGKKPTMVDAETGEVRPVELFVAVWGASNYTFADATATQQIPDWLGSHVRAFEFVGGVPAAVVPDQLKTGVTGACRYEPELQRSYEELAGHYGTVMLPARPARPRDKAKVEVGVQVAQRWILARLRHETPVGLGALNRRIRDLLDELNDRVMRHYGASRRALFLALDHPAMRPLPATRFEPGSWKWVRANIDYTSNSRATATACPSRSDRSASSSDPPRAPSRSSTTVSGSRSISATSAADGTPRSRLTCRTVINSIWNGRPRGSSAGAPPSAPPSRRW